MTPAPYETTWRELFAQNPMTLEATRTVRRFLRAGTGGDNTGNSRYVNVALFSVLAFLYIWMLILAVTTREDMGRYITFGEAALLTLVIPGSLYGAIAVEREKQTFDALIMTRLTPAQIVCGKLYWRVGMVLGVMALFLPPIVLSHFAGAGHQNSDNLTIGQMLWMQVIVFAWSVLLGAMSIWVSAKSKKGITALLTIVGIVVVFAVGVTALIYLVGITIELKNADTQPSMWAFGFLLSTNPLLLLVENPQGVFHCCAPAIGNYWCNYWIYHGSVYWSVALYALLSALFVRGAVKTLRGLELPMVDNRKRGISDGGR